MALCDDIIRETGLFIFDVDGVLVRSDELHRSTAKLTLEAFKQRGHINIKLPSEQGPMSKDEQQIYDSLVDFTSRNGPAEVINKFKELGSEIGFNKPYLSEDECRVLKEEYDHVYTHFYTTRVFPQADKRDYVSDLSNKAIERLSALHKYVAAITGATQGIASLNLNALTAEYSGSSEKELFDAFVYAERDMPSKPNPGVFDRVSRELAAKGIDVMQDVLDKPIFLVGDSYTDLMLSQQMTKRFNGKPKCRFGYVFGEKMGGPDYVPHPDPELLEVADISFETMQDFYDCLPIPPKSRPKSINTCDSTNCP